MSENQEIVSVAKELVGKLNFLGARDRLRDVVEETKLIYSAPFSAEYGNRVYIKPENLQTTGAFKIRGAYNKVAKLTPEERKKGIITASAGNHAQGVAFSAKALGVAATIVMPKTTPIIKVERTKRYGVDVVLAGDFYDDAYAHAVKLAEEKDFVFVHPFDDLDVIEGQGTIAIEILDDLKDADVLLVPIGGGGLISGVAVAAKAIKPSIKIIGVEPEGAESMKCSIDAGGVICLDCVNTIADGAAVREPGPITYSIVDNYVDEIVTVTDFEIMSAFIEVLEEHKLIAESAGLLSIAGLSKISDRDKNVVCVLSGGNIDVLTVASMVNKGLVSKGRIFKFSVNLPDKPGELLAISEILADAGANVVKINHDQFVVTDRFINVLLEITVETNGWEHIDEIVKKLQSSGYKIQNAMSAER